MPTKTYAHANEVLQNLIDAGIWLGLSSTVVSLSSPTATEPSGGGYARVQPTLSAPVNGQTANTAVISFPESTAAWLNGAEIIQLTVNNAASGGAIKRRVWLDSQAPKYFLPTDVNVASDRLTISGHGYTNGASVVLESVEGATPPAGLTVETRYFVKAIDANTIELYTDAALSTIVNLTSQGSGLHKIFQFYPRKVDAPRSQIYFKVGDFVLSEA